VESQLSFFPWQSGTS